MTDALVRLRIEARDDALAHLDSMRRTILRDVAPATDRVSALLRAAFDAEPLLDHRFWLRATADVIAATAPVCPSATPRRRARRR